VLATRWTLSTLRTSYHFWIKTKSAAMDIHRELPGNEDDVMTAISAGPTMSQSWRAADAVGCVYTSGDPKTQQ